MPVGVAGRACPPARGFLTGFVSGPRHAGPHAREPARLDSVVAAGPPAEDRRRTGRPAGGLAAHRLPRHRGAERRRDPGVRRARARRRVPAGRRVPHPADRPDQAGGRGALPRRPARRGLRTGPRTGRREHGAQTAGRAPGRTAIPRRPGPRAVPPGRGVLVPRHRSHAAAAGSRGRGVAAAPCPDPVPALGRAPRSRPDRRAVRRGAQGRSLVPGRPAFRGVPDLPGGADRRGGAAGRDLRSGRRLRPGPLLVGLSRRLRRPAAPGRGGTAAVSGGDAAFAAARRTGRGPRGRGWCCRGGRMDSGGRSGRAAGPSRA